MKSLPILWTHSVFEESSLISRLSQIRGIPEGFSFIHEPLLEIQQKIKVSGREIKKHQAIFVTSGHALNSLIEIVSLDLPVYAVGDQTRACAKRMGLKKVISAQGCSRDLKNRLVKELDPKKGALLYIRGNVVCGNIKKDLEKEGFYVNEIIGYNTESKKNIFSTNSRFFKGGKNTRCFLILKEGGTNF